MIILIDYENLDRLMRQRGLRHVITSLLDVLGSSLDSRERKAVCRLYGGWLEGEASSRNAERLVPEIQNDFPSTFPLTRTGGPETVLVHVELARTLACDPSAVLTHTYRRRSLPSRLRCEAAPFPDCAIPSRCPVAVIEPFIRNADCPIDDCSVEPRRLLVREEQKLVDSMLVIDLVHFAQTSQETLVVVSADDDLWPGIRFVLLSGVSITHIVPSRGRADPKRYRHLHTQGYSQVLM